MQTRYRALRAGRRRVKRRPARPKFAPVVKSAGPGLRPRVTECFCGPGATWRGHQGSGASALVWMPDAERHARHERRAKAVWADGKKIEVARDGDGYIAAATVALRTS